MPGQGPGEAAEPLLRRHANRIKCDAGIRSPGRRGAQDPVATSMYCAPRGYPHLRRHERLKGHLGELVEPKIGDHRGRFRKEHW